MANLPIDPRLLVAFAMVAACGKSETVDIPGDETGDHTNTTEEVPITADLYVSTTGDDDADGLTRETALATIAEAVERVQSGQSIGVLTGEYSEEVMFFERDFEATVSLIGETGAVLDGLDTLDTGVLVYDSTNISVEGFEIRGYLSQGYYGIVTSDVAIRDCEVHHNGSASSHNSREGFGINAAYSSSVVIQENVVFENGPAPDRVADGVLGTGINTYALKNSQILDNTSTDNIGGGILVEDGIDVTVEGNVSSGNDSKAPLLNNPGYEWWCGGIWLDGGHDIFVRDNTFNDNVAGVHVSDLDLQQPFGYVVEDNEIAGNQYGFQIYGFNQCLPDPSTLSMSGNDITESTDSDVFCDDYPYAVPIDVSVTGTLLDADGTHTVSDGSLSIGYGYLAILTATFDDVRADRIVLRHYGSEAGGGVVIDESSVSVALELDNVHYDIFVDPADPQVDAVFTTSGGLLEEVTYTFADDLTVYEWDFPMGETLDVLAGSAITFTMQ